ncbi:MAG TPA: LUD domain-containing protein, partial [Candidatus Limnocylindrales bacterium]|nr:LUD domain-containing protein [Candidatus Limnocylindrales bacterium]
MAIANPPSAAKTEHAQPTYRSPAHEAAVARAESLIQTSDFAKPADESTLEATVAALKDKGYDVHVADSAEDAKRIVLELLPDGAEVGQGASQTLDQIGVTHEIEESGRYTPVRKITRSMDRSTP